VLILAVSIGRCPGRLLPVPSGNSVPVTVPLIHILPSRTRTDSPPRSYRCRGASVTRRYVEPDLTSRAGLPAGWSATLVPARRPAR
jgi:hypothetical protein